MFAAEATVMVDGVLTDNTFLQGLLCEDNGNVIHPFFSGGHGTLWISVVTPFAHGED